MEPEEIRNHDEFLSVKLKMLYDPALRGDVENVKGQGDKKDQAAHGRGVWSDCVPADCLGSQRNQEWMSFGRGKSDRICVLVLPEWKWWKCARRHA